MDRRRGLLSQSKAGSGKVVNVITLKNLSMARVAMMSMYAYAQYPVASDVFIGISIPDWGNEILPMFKGEQERTYMEVAAATTSEITVISVDPQEDDTYIYEAVVEY